MDECPKPTAEELRQLWPLAFNDKRPPLQIGIHVSLSLPFGIRALRHWTQHPVYLRNLIAGQQRVGVDGVPCATPTNSERERAWRVLMLLKSELVGRSKHNGLTADEIKAEFKLRLPKPDKTWVFP